MTFEQLSVFVAVADRQHVTRAAAALGLTPSAVSASVKALEGYYNVRLFDRVGRRIELTREGRTFLAEAKATLARVREAELVLSEMGGLARGAVDVQASQTIAAYWLPPRLLAFHDRYPGVEVRLTVGNTRSVADAVVEGAAELGLVEGAVDDPRLSMRPLAEDDLVAVVRHGHPAARRPPGSAAELVRSLTWIMREEGSGTRSEFEHALREMGVEPASLPVALTLPSNESVLTAVRAGDCAAVLSRAVVEPFLANVHLATLDLTFKSRPFVLLRHRERHLSLAAGRLEALCRPAGA